MRLRAVFPVGLAALSLGLTATARADTWTVTNGSSDATTPACSTAAHTCVSLRTALAASEATKEIADTITVPAGTINVSDDLVIASDITVIGASARTNVIDGGLKYRGFRVGAGANAKISHFTIRNAAAGQAASNDGGGVLNQAGTVALDFVRITGSTAGRGGGVANLPGGLLSLQHTLIDGNAGGGVVNVGGPETTPLTYVTMADSTVVANTGPIGGAGGITNLNRGLFVLLRSTVADNVGGARSAVGGFFVATAGTAQSVGSILARNRTDAGAAANCGATRPLDGGANVEDNDSCGFTFTGNPLLDTKLSNAGGELDVLALLAGSPAIDRVVTGDNCPAGTLDQRSLSRPQGTGCDAGAYEFDQAATFAISSGPSGTVNSGDVEFTFSANEPGATPVCQLTGPGQTAGYVACYKSNAQPYAGLANGTYTFSVRDSAFPASTPATRTFTVAALDTSITGGPGGTTNDATPTFTFTGVNGASSFQCRVDSAAFATCASPYTTAALTQGAHTFEVRALSAAGAPDPTPAARSFTVDTVAPDTTITGGPTGTVASASATFTYTASETGSTFQCSLDGAAFGACPASYTGLAQGAHTFGVRAIDAAGNVDATPATRTWTVDTVAPSTTLTPVSSPTNDTTPTFAFTSEAGATFQCRLDGAAFAACSSPVTTAVLTQGSHTFDVRATDGAANVGAAASQTFVVDTTAPDTTLTPIGTPTGDNTPTFAFTSEAGATFQCRVDAAAFAACSSPLTTAALADGSHTFAVRAVDAAGNPDPTPATQTFTVDTAAPDTTITAGADPVGNDNTPTFAFTSSEGSSTFQCRVDAAAFAPCSTPLTTAALSDGSHTFAVRAVDAAGNVDTTPASQTFVVDTTTPNTDITAGPGAATNDSTPTFTFSGTGGAASFQCRIDGGAFAACTSPFTTPVLAAGPHTVDIRALSAAGTADPSPATRSFVVDLTAPNTTLTPVASPSNDTTPTFAFASSEAGSTFQCQVDGGAFASCASPFTPAALTPGSHTFAVRATDPAGNVDATPAGQTFVIDTSAPETTLAPFTSPTNTATPTFTFSSEPGSTFACRVDGAAFAPCGSPFTTAALTQASHTFDVRATDAAGNTDATPATVTFTVDTTPPDPPVVTSGPDGPTTDASPAFAFDTAGAADTVCRLDGPGGAAGAFGPCTSPTTFSGLAPGAYVFFVRSSDAAGNTRITQRAFTVTAVQQATPTPTPAPSATPTPTAVPTPGPVDGVSVDIKPVAGTVLIKLPGAKKFVRLDPSVIRNGSEVDAREGTVEITRADGGRAKFYAGIFKISQTKGGYTTLTLTEKLTGCPKAKKATATASAKKPKTRKLWGDGKGRFRTKGQYSAATVRGTKWLVQDSCTTTLTRVAQGVVEVEDFTAKKKVLVKQGKRYTARAKKR